MHVGDRLRLLGEFLISYSFIVSALIKCSDHAFSFNKFKGKPETENSRSCRCDCQALIRLLHAADNSWYITEHRESHNHSMSWTMGEKVHWPSHTHIDVYTGSDKAVKGE